MISALQQAYKQDDQSGVQIDFFLGLAQHYRPPSTAQTQLEW
jgi:hypothetical protein